MNDVRDEDKSRDTLIQELRGLRQQLADATEKIETSDILPAVIKEMTDVFFIKNLQGRYLLVNQAFLDFGGWTSEQVIGQDDYALFPEEIAHNLKAYDEQTILHGTAKNYEEVVQSTNGTVTVITTKGVYRNSNDQIIGVFGIAKDISLRKISEQKLAQTTEQLTTILNSLPVITYAAKAEGDLGATYVSPSASKITDYQPEDFTSDAEFWTSHIHPQDIDRVLAAFGDILELGQLEIEYRWRVADNSYRWFSDVCHVVRNAQGNIDHVAGIWHDITQRKQLEEQLLQSQKLEALGTLAGGIAHDFNNILATILGKTELLLLNFTEDSPAKKGLEQIYKSGERGADLVRQIMTFSRMDLANFSALNLSNVVADALNMVRATLPANINIIQNLLADCPAIRADETQIHQIILNLCSNAYHAMGERGGDLEVSLTQENSDECICTVSGDTCLNLTVTDSGLGIKPEDQERIFDPFFTTKEVGKGTGLGLSVVHGIMEKHQGKITLHSQEGKGSRFSLYFPIIEQEIEPPSSVKPAAILGQGHILIVEDEPSLANVYQEFLQGLGFNTKVYHDGSAALAGFKQDPNQFDLVITDHAMPNLTGKQLAPKLREIRADMPILLLTGYGDLLHQGEAQKLGISKCLVKPIKLSELLEAVVAGLTIAKS